MSLHWTARETSRRWQRRRSSATLQIIGEAVNHLPAEITDAHPEIGWPQIRGFRNILVHQYFGVDVDVVRDVVDAHLPPLAEALRDHVADD